MAVFNRCRCGIFNSVKKSVCSSCNNKLKKNYYIQYTVDGKRKTEHIGSSIAFAREVLLRRKADVMNNKISNKPKSIKWVDFFDSHYRFYCQNNLKTFDEFRFNLARNFHAFQKHMDKITRYDLEKFRESLNNGKRAKSTINRYMHVATFALNYAENLELIDHSPARKFKMYKENPVERRSLTADEEKKLLEACKISKNKILYHVVMIALYTGMRSSEILNIKWSHVSLNEMSIRIYKSKNNESREIPIIDLLKPVFFDLKSITGGNEYVISSCYGEKINSVKKSYNQAVKNADIGHFTFHELRHTLVTRLASSGASILEIQQISGHKSESMVRRYTHVGLKESRRTIERLEKHLSSE